MTERVTFFAEMGPEPADRSHRLEAQGPGGSWVLLAWTRQRGRPLAPRSETGAGYEALVQDLREQVLSLGGGVLAEVQRASGEVRIHRLVVNGQGDVHRIIRLSPLTGDGEEVLDHEIEELQLGRGEHLLVPVSPRAEERMLQLRDLLSDMGPDVKALVLHTLRSPSLEARLGRLEEAVELDRSGASRAPWWSRRRWRREKAASQKGHGRVGVAATRWRPITVVVVVLLLALVLLAGWFTLHRGDGSAGSPATEIQEVTETPAGSQPDGGDAPASRTASNARGAADGHGDGLEASPEAADPKAPRKPAVRDRGER